MTKRGLKIATIGLCNCSINMISDMAENLTALQKMYSVTSAADVMANIPDIHFDPALLRALQMVPVSYLKYYYMYMQPEMLAECARAAENEGCRGEVIRGVEKELFALYQDAKLAVKPPQLAKRGGRATRMPPAR